MMETLTAERVDDRPAAAGRSRRYIVFADFDETYYPHRYDAEHRAAFENLELKLEEWTRSERLIFGIVSGNSFEHIVKALKQREHRFFPNFIAADFGASVLHYQADVGYVEDPFRRRKVDAAAYDKNRALALGEILAAHGIEVREANSSAKDRYRTSFYLKPGERFDEEHLVSLIHDLATANRLQANFSRCNPKAGDPTGWFDLDLIPAGVGKKEVVAYLLDYYGLNTGEAVAFGDSCNDLEMLLAVKYGFLLSNAVNQAKRKFSATTQFPYAQGIYEVLAKLIY